MLFEGISKQPPSLVDLCVRTAIDHVRYIGYVGGIEFGLLDTILQHCTLEQLTHIEDCTDDTDLSLVTDKFWKRFFRKDYGEMQFDDCIEKMKKFKANYKWRDLYEAKMKDVQRMEEECAERLKQRYKNEDGRKQSRQTQLCKKTPPAKRPFWGNTATSYNLSNVKSNIMKKAKLELLKSHEVKNLTAIKRNTIQKSTTPPLKRPGLSSTNVPSSSRSNYSYGGGMNSFGGVVKNGLAATKSRILPKNFCISAPRRTGLSANLPSSSRSIPSSIKDQPQKRVNNLPVTPPSTSRSIPSSIRDQPEKRINNLPVTPPSTSRNAATKRKHIM